MALDSDQVAMASHGVTLGLVSVLASSWAGIIPPILAAFASALALIWYAIQIWESQTVKRMRRGWGLAIPPDIDACDR